MREIEAYKTNDGTIYESEAEARDHEENIVHEFIKRRVSAGSLGPHVTMTDSVIITALLIEHRQRLIELLTY